MKTEPSGDDLTDCHRSIFRADLQYRNFLKALLKNLYAALNQKNYIIRGKYFILLNKGVYG